MKKFKLNWKTIFKELRFSNPLIITLKRILTPKFLINSIIPQGLFENILSGITNKPKEQEIFRLIIAYSIFVGALVGMPGTLGYGVIIAKIAEILMAFHIARYVGLISWDAAFSLEKIKKLVLATGVTSITVFVVFKEILDLIYHLFAQIFPFGAPVTFMSATTTTLFYGMFIYLSFVELKKNPLNKKIPLKIIIQSAKNAGVYTYNIGKSLMKFIKNDAPNFIKEVRSNIRDFYNINQTIEKQVKGEFFLTGCMAYLLMGKSQELSAPFGQLWLQAWRMEFQKKLDPNASFSDIKNLAESYDKDQLENVQQSVNAKFFELLEVEYENADGDMWSAELMKDQNHPVSDAIFTNKETGQLIEINYKFSTNKEYIERHIQEHKDVPVIVPQEIEEKINSPFLSHFKKEDILEVSQENFDRVLIKQHELYLGVVGTGFASFLICILPFCKAFYAEKISREQFTQALKTFFPDVTAKTINRIVMFTLFGPLYGTFLIASLAMKGILYGFDQKEDEEKKPESNKTISRTIKSKKRFKEKFSRRELITLSLLKEINIS